MRRSFFLLFLLANTEAFAGGILLCDDHGNQCLAPSPSCAKLIPPVRDCTPYRGVNVEPAPGATEPFSAAEPKP